MRSQNGMFIYVVGIASISARMIMWKAKSIKVLRNRDYGKKLIVAGVIWEARFDQLASYRDWMIFL